jgi:LPS export ABC transporter permease LptG/LPS export ABC transporter permease LptF
MLRILDNYIIREIGPSFGLGLGVFTFVLLLNEILRYARILITQAASVGHVVGILINLLPSVLCVTIPMGVLLGILIALGRMSADSEITALRASGVSLYRLVRPILVAAAIGWAASSYFIIYVLPDSNQAVRQLFFQVLTSKVKTDIRPRVFYDNLFPNLMFLALDIPTGSDTWQNVFLADLSNPGAPRITLAREGRLIIDPEERTVNFYLRDGEMHQVNYGKPDNYDLQAFDETVLPIQGETFFPPDQVNVPRGPREMGFQQLFGTYQQTNLPVYLVEIHKKFSIPFACFVFGILGLGFGIKNRREGRSWGFVVSIAIIFIYYVLIKLGEEMAVQERLSPLISMWSVNVIMGVAGVLLLVRNAREAYGFQHAIHIGLKSLGTRVRRSVAGRLTTRSTSPSSRPVVVIRIPRIVIRFPNTLDRYITREFLRYFFLILSALVTIYILGEILNILEPVFENRIKGKLVFQYIGVVLPEILFRMLPLATLMATLVNFAIFTKTSEITAIKAGGVSLYRISLAPILIGAVASLVCFALQDYVLPYSNRRAAELDDEIHKRPVQTHNLMDRRWMLGREQHIYHYSYFDPGESVFKGLAVYHFDPSNFRLSQRLYANQAGWDSSIGAWILQGGWERVFDEVADVERFNELIVRDIEPPAYFVKEEKQSDQMTYVELENYIEDLSQSGFDVMRYKVALHSKIALPLAAMITVIIGIPFSFTPGKKGALYGIGIAIVLGLSYYVTARVFTYMGDSAMLPPLLAAWAPNILFGVAALYGLFNVKT